MKSAAHKYKPSPNTNNTRKGPFLKKEGQQTNHVNKRTDQSFIQPSLSFGKQNDRFEQEADQVADQVTGHSNTQVQSRFLGNDEGISNFLPGENSINRQSFFEPRETAPEKGIQPKANKNSSPVIRRHPASVSRTENTTTFSDSTEIHQKKDETTDQSSESDSQFESGLIQTKGGGSTLPNDTRSAMESGIGANFSQVKIHTDSNAAQLSDSIGAQAFTHGNDIYFNEGKYDPKSTEGKHLLAHELTHTVQQGASVQSKEKGITKTGKRVQRSWVGDAWDSVSGAVSGAIDWAADQIDEAKDWLIGELRGLVSDIPGYSLFTVVIGRDPIANRTVARNGRNFIEAGLDIIPNGESLKQKLEQEGALQEAASWLDEQIDLMDIKPTEIMSQFRNWWDDLSISDVGRPREVLNELLNIFSGPMNRIIRFARNVASKLLEIIKDYVLSQVVNFIKERTTAYPLLRVILSEDPITGEEVPRNGMNLLTGFISLHPRGEEQLRQMRESGSLQRAANWLDISFIRVFTAVMGIKNAFSQAWDLITIENLLSPIETFQRIYNLFAEPVGEIFSFMWEVATMILKFIKDALLQRLSNFARNTRGYPLITVLLGKDPFTGNTVSRTPENIIRGFMSLTEGGEEKFNQLKESGAIQRTTQWIEGAVARLNITWTYIKGLFVNLWNSFSLDDLINPFAAFGRIVQTFAPPIRRLFAFIWEVIKKVVEIALQLMNFPVKTVRSIISNAMQAFEDIKRDPVGFFLNLLKAVKQGFSQFFDKFIPHLLNGVRDWLFGELRSAGIQPPADLSFRSVLGMVMNVLGITVENIWDRLAQKIGQEKVDRIRGMVDRLTGIWTFVKDVMERGPIAIWEKIQEKISDLWGMVVDHVKNWVVTKIIQKVTTKLLSMLDPTGIMAVVNGFIAFFRAVQSFIEKLREMLEIVNSFVAGVANIARGDISQAANYLENALARGIPVAIGFLANQVGLRGLGERISEMIESIREKINGAIDWLIDKAISLGQGVLNMARSGIEAVREWWRNRTTVNGPNGETHNIFFEGSETSSTLMIQSEKQTFQSFVNAIDVGSDAEKQAAKTAASDIAQNIDTIRANNDLSSEEKDAQIKPLLTSLRTHTEKLFGAVPETGEIATTGTNAAGFGVSMHVKPLTHRGPEGSRPTQARHTVYDALNMRRKSGGSFYYVRGHLLNQQLHGPGTWDNMTPLSVDGNSEHEREVESRVKRAVDSGGIVEYEVLPQYGSQPNKSQLLTEIENSDDDINQKNAKKEIVEAEDNVPLSLQCTAITLDRQQNPDSSLGLSISNVSVNNSIERTLGTYYLTGVPKPPAIDLNSASIHDLMALPRIGQVRAQSIYETRQERGRNFGTYDVLTREAGVPQATMDNLRSRDLVYLGT